jgi:hypothetical protein
MAKDVLNSKSLSEYHERILKEVLEGTYRPPNSNKNIALFFLILIMAGLSKIYHCIVTSDYDWKFVANLICLVINIYVVAKLIRIGEGDLIN